MSYKLFSQKDDLYHYAKNILDGGVGDLKLVVDGLNLASNPTSLVIDRRGQFQTELFIFAAGKGAPDHLHPNVESIEYQLSGSLHLFLGETNVMRGKPMEVCEDRYAGVGIRIKSGLNHRAQAGEKGVAFLSFQKWLNGVKPSSVLLDWRGDVVSGAHKDLLDGGNNG